MRPIGTEREVALGVRPPALGAPGPADAKGVFERISAILSAGRGSCPALYYKGGRFLGDGSLLHFEISQLEDPRQGLLEWASPECLGAWQAALYAQAQEEALIEAREALAGEGEYEPILLGNTCDRFGNSYGAHESYEVEDRLCGPRAWLGAAVLHPLVLLLLGLGLIAFLTPLFLVLGVGLLLYGLISLPAQIPGLGAPFQAGLRGMERTGTYLLEPGPGPLQGVAARTFVSCARIGGVLFSFSARWTLFSGYLPGLLPFLATRPLIVGAGHLDAHGRYRLTPRAAISDRTLAAFVIGSTRPLVDVKALYFRAPWRYLERRQRLHLICGDSTRCPWATWLRLATTELVLEALGEGGLVGLSAALELPEGPLGAFRRAAEPDLSLPVALLGGQPISGLRVQRLYLEGVEGWAAARAEALGPEQRAALGAWRELLDDLEAGGPQAAVDRCDWARKLALLEGALRERWPGRSAAEAWSELARWGELNAWLELHAPDLPPESEALSEAPLSATLGRRRARVFRARVDAVGSPEEWAAARGAWLTLKSLDLAYHEFARASPFSAGSPPPRPRFAAQALHEARHEAPPTRARVRALALRLQREGRGAGLELGWERLRARSAGGEVFELALPDVLQTELERGDQSALERALDQAPSSGDE